VRGFMRYDAMLLEPILITIRLIGLGNFLDMMPTF